jgi:hypothetical protein
MYEYGVVIQSRTKEDQLYRLATARSYAREYCADIPQDETEDFCFILDLEIILSKGHINARERIGKGDRTET